MTILYIFILKQASVEVQYGMDTSNFDQGVAIATGVLCALAVLYATLRTFTWNKRSGKVKCPNLIRLS